MNALIFNGSMEGGNSSTSGKLSHYIAEVLEKAGIRTRIFNLLEAEIPMLDFTVSKTPDSVILMNQLFLEADVHFWLAPLYHGSMPGAMKNSLDWLETTAKHPVPYLTDKKIGLICWADGLQAMQGINAMDSVAKALRAWTIPFSIPFVRNAIFEEKDSTILTTYSKEKIDTLINLAISRKVDSVIPTTI